MNIQYQKQQGVTLTAPVKLEEIKKESINNIKTIGDLMLYIITKK